MFIFYCCATGKWQHKYINKHIHKLEKKYAVTNEYAFTIPSSLFVNKLNSEISRKEVKHNVAAMERLFALIPDSIFVTPNKIDIFYNDQNKIAYI